MQKQKKSMKHTSAFTETVTTMLLCAGIQLVTFIAACILAMVIDVHSNGYYIFSIGSFCVGGAISGFLSVKKKRKNGLISGIIYALPSCVLYIFISAAMNAFKIDYLIAVSFVLIVLSSASGGVLSVNIRPKAKVKVKRH